MARIPEDELERLKREVSLLDRGRADQGGCDIQRPSRNTSIGRHR